MYIYKSLFDRYVPNFLCLGIILLKKNNKTSFESVDCYAIPEHETPQPEMS